jgi:phosphatidylethanolamine-binding protein (PEBP) family uncharacterized protein
VIGPARLDIDLVPLVDKMFALLLSEPDAVRQQQVLELLIVKNAFRMGHPHIVADGIHKHVKQIIAQFQKEAAS